MRRLAVSVLLLSSVSLPLALRAETERSAAISRDNLAAHINYLASDELGGRGVNSKGIDQAAEYIARRFLDVGLLPGGDDGSYFQRFELHGRTRITDRCRLEVAGKRITCEVDEDCVPMPFSSQDEFEGQVAFVGYGITNHEKNYDDYADINVQGKVALMLRYEPQRWKDQNQGQLSSHASFTTKANLAKENGAVAVVIVHPPTKEEDDLYRFRRPSPGALPMFHITRRFANRILAAGGLSPIEDLYDTLNASTTPNSVDLSGIALKGDPGLSTLKAKNVIGNLQGRRPNHSYHQPPETKRLVVLIESPLLPLEVTDDINVQGKVALMLRYEPQRWKDQNQGQLSSHASFTTKANLAKENGAVAVVIVHPPTKEEDDLYRFRRPSPGALPMFHITRRFANRILAAGGLSPIEDLYDTLNASTTPNSVDLSGIALKGDPGLSTLKAKNVIGILPGEGPLADEYVVFGGHYDHLGTVPSRRGRRLQ